MRSDLALLKAALTAQSAGAPAGEMAEYQYALAACDTMLPATRLIAAGAVAPVLRGLYQLQYTRLKTARSAG